MKMSLHMNDDDDVRVILFSLSFSRYIYVFKVMIRAKNVFFSCYR